MARKKDVDSSPSEKVVGLYGLLLFTGRKYSLSELADKFRCSKQTILRMVETIERSHTLMLVTEIENGSRWFWVEAPKRVPNLMLRPEDVRYLTLCKEMVANLLPEGVRSDIERTIDVSTALVPDRSKTTIMNSLMATATTKGHIDYDKHKSTIDTLLDAQEGQYVCIVRYAKSDGAIYDYHFAADRLHVRPPSVYAEGWRVTERGTPEILYEQTLAIHRIQDLTLTNRGFDFPDKRKIEPYFGFGFSEPFRVKVVFDASVATYVSEREWSSEQTMGKRPDGSVELEFIAQSEGEVLSWILGFGDKAELLEPSAMRQGLLKSAHSLVAKYG